MDWLALPLGLAGMFAAPVAIGFATYNLLRRAWRAVEDALEQRTDGCEAAAPVITTVMFRGARHAIGATRPRFDRAA
ncbi:MAG: hypothetical protein AB7I42_26530 [Bradyrhizobium sp.]|uniref:hypothetical protein n=1 Tax=Bradyrhizobium sp. TaxID=376 RepID=UPI003D0D459D